MARYRRCRETGCHNRTMLPHWYCDVHRDKEEAYLKSREKWAHKTKQSTHKYNTVIRNRSEDKTEQYNFYRTRQWANLRQQVLDRDGYVCQYCKAQGKLTYDAKTVDHIVPIEVEPNDKTDIDNLATICRQCHRVKTDWERKYYGTGQGNTLRAVPTIKKIAMVNALMNKQVVNK